MTAEDWQRPVPYLWTCRVHYPWIRYCDMRFCHVYTHKPARGHKPPTRSSCRVPALGRSDQNWVSHVQHPVLLLCLLSLSGGFQIYALPRVTTRTPRTHSRTSFPLFSSLQPLAVPPPQGLAVNFNAGRGGGPFPPGPPPPLPPQLKCTRKPGFWEHFLVMGKKFSAPSAHAIHCVHIASCVLHIPCFPDYHAPTLVVSVFELPGPTVTTRKT